MQVSLLKIIFALLYSLNYVTVQTQKDWSDDYDDVQKSFISAVIMDLENKNISTNEAVKAKALRLISQKR